MYMYMYMYMYIILYYIILYYIILYIPTRRSVTHVNVTLRFREHTMFRDLSGRKGETLYCCIVPICAQQDQLLMADTLLDREVCADDV